MSKTAYAVFRTLKLKSLDDIARVSKHDSRDKEHLPDNVDAARSKNNILLKGSGDSRKEFEEATAGVKYRSNSVLGYDAVCTFSNHVDLSEKELEKWSKKSIKWLEQAFGKNNVRNVWLHMDEDTPHLHAFIVPLIEKNGVKSLNAREFTGGAVKLQQLQTSYYNAVKEFGLQRGIEGSRAKHMSAKEYKKRKESIQARIEKMDSKTMQKEYVNALLRIEQLELEHQSYSKRIGGLEERLNSSNFDLNKAYEAQQQANKKIAYFEQKIKLMKNIDPKVESFASKYQKDIPTIAKLLDNLPESKRSKLGNLDLTQFKNSQEAIDYISNILHPLSDGCQMSHIEGIKQINPVEKRKTYNQEIKFMREFKPYQAAYKDMNFSMAGSMLSIFVGIYESCQRADKQFSYNIYNSNLKRLLKEFGYTDEQIDEYLKGNENALKKKERQMEMG